MDLGKLWLGARATLFLACLGLLTLIYFFVLPFLLLLPYSKRYAGITFWNRSTLWLLKVICGIDYKVLGRENIPTDTAAIIMSNHQSTWETLALPVVFPPLTWVLKKELLKIPIFGRGLRFIKPIAIDRNNRKNSMEQIKIQGKERLDDGIWVVIFPEGTRVMPGEKKRYKMGGGILAAHSGYPVVPVAHNGGDSWPRHSYIKKPGTITMSIGKPVPTEGRTSEEIMRQVETWIEAERAKLVF